MALPKKFIFGARFFSNFEAAKPKFSADAPDPDIPPEEFKRMQSSIARFSQAMSLGKYGVA